MSRVKPIVVLPPQCIGRREDLEAAGYVVIGHDDPAKVRVITPEQSLASASDLLLSALDGLAGGNSIGREKFFFALHSRIKKRNLEVAS